jgi:galactokinase
VIDLGGLISEFVERHGVEPRLFSAPGRVNLIGEHTDYNDGFVFPMAIERSTVIAAVPRHDRLLRIRSLNFDQSVEVDLERPGTPQRGGFIDYVEGMARVLEGRGFRLAGAEMLLDSDVPGGAGLSSSAALEMALGLALLSLSGVELDRVSLAKAGQQAEHEWVGTRCGIMDQFISALGRPGHALLVDCRSLEATPVPLDLTVHAIVIIDSRVKHELASGEYNTRRAECEAAARTLGKKALRDVTLDELAPLTGDPAKRARHVVGENERTVEAARLLKAGDLRGFGNLMFASHASLRDDYQVSCPELDLLVESARSVPGVLGARMTGGGFGGCTVNLVARGAVDALERTVVHEYEQRFGRRPQLFVTGAAGGVGELSPARRRDRT